MTNVSDIQDLNFAEWLEKDEWLLDDAVSILRGEKPKEPFSEGSDDIKRRVVFNFKTRTYQMALKAIKAKELKAWDYVEIDHKTFSMEGHFWEESWMVKPKWFIGWAIANKLPVHEDLEYLCSYKYWISKKHWSFNEAVVLLQSDSSPLPEEVFGVLECEETYELATKVVNAIKLKKIKHKYDSVEFNPPPWTALVESYSFIQWADKEKIKFPSALNAVVSYWKKVENRTEIQRKEAQSISEGEYDDLLSMPSWTIEEAMNILIGVRPETSLKLVSDLDLFGRHLDVATKISKSWEAGTFKVIGSKHDLDNHKGHVEPLVFLEWAVRYGIMLPQRLLAIKDGSSFKGASLESGYTTPYIELMKRAIIENNISDENQDTVESLKWWFEDKGMSQRLAKAMATLIRMPTSQAGNAKKSKTG